MNLPNPLSKGAPPSPDYQGAAEQQTRANRPNQYTPWASSTWSPAGSTTSAPRMVQHQGEQMYVPGVSVPGSGQMEQHTGLSPQLDQANQSMMGQFANAWGSPLDNGASARQKATDAIYGQATSRLDPQWNQRQHDMGVSLDQQGIDPSSAAYGKQQDIFNRGRNDDYNQALYSAIMGGGQEAQRQQQMDLTSRFAPLQGMSGLQSLSGMPNPGQAGNYQQAAAQQGQYGLQAQQMNQGFWNDLIGGGTGFLKGLMSPGGGGGVNGAWEGINAAGGLPLAGLGI